MHFASVEAWLRTIELEAYSEAIQALGYTSLRYLQDADHADIVEAASELRLKKPQAKRLVAEWVKMVDRSVAPSESVAPQMATMVVGVEVL